MAEITSILTDDQGTITHLETEEGERLSVSELAQKLEAGEDYFVTFGDVEHYPFTIVAEDGHLEPTIDDPSGVHTIRDLPQQDDPEEAEIDEMFGELGRMGEFNGEGLDNTEQTEDTI